MPVKHDCHLPEANIPKACGGRAVSVMEIVRRDPQHQRCHPCQRLQG